MEKKVTSLQDRWAKLGDGMKDARDKLLRAAGQGAELDGIVGGILDWIGGLNKRLRNQEPIAVKSALVDKQIEDHKVVFARERPLYIRTYIRTRTMVCVCVYVRIFSGIEQALLYTHA